MARNKMQTTTSGFGYLDGKPIGKRKFLVKGEFDIVMKEEVVLIAHDRESAEDRFIEFASKKAKQLGGELGTTFIDFAEDEAYFSG